MPTYAPKVEAKQQIEAGTFIARCYSMVHIGTIKYNWNGEDKEINKVRFTFELPTEKRVFKQGEEEKPLVISQEFSLSLHPKSKLRPILEAWRGKTFTDAEIDNFDISKVVGLPAFITVTHNEKGYAQITYISKLPKGTECPPQVNPSQLLEYDNFNEQVFEKLPKFLQEKIVSSKEYKKMKGITTTEIDEIEYPEDESSPSSIPF